MAHLIDKDALVAKIRGYINNAEAFLKYHHNRNDKTVYAFEQEKLVMCELLSSLDALEVQEEPVSEDKMTISKEWFEHCKKSWYNEGYIDGEYNRDRQFEKPVSDDLEEFINELSKQFPEVSFAKVCKIATRTAKWQKSQMMAKAINTKASLIMSVPTICISLPLGVNVGDKVKVIVIKEE